MCGRFAVTLPPDALRALFGFAEHPNYPARHNIAPTQPIAIVRAACEGAGVVRHYALVRWGFLPAFVKEPAAYPLVFNARAEGLGEKASFRNALRRRRCLVPADAFYEWHRVGSGKATQVQPYAARRRDGETMGLAALWETWTGPNGEEVDTACIVTTAANGVSASIHPRLPAVVERRDWSIWLDPAEDAIGGAIALLRPVADDVLEFRPVSDRVNSVANDDEAVEHPVGPPLGSGAGAACEAVQLGLF